MELDVFYHIRQRTLKTCTCQRRGNAGPNGGEEFSTRTLQWYYLTRSGVVPQSMVVRFHLRVLPLRGSRLAGKTWRISLDTPTGAGVLLRVGRANSSSERSRHFRVRREWCYPIRHPRSNASPCVKGTGTVRQPRSITLVWGNEMVTSDEATHHLLLFTKRRKHLLK